MRSGHACHLCQPIIGSLETPPTKRPHGRLCYNFPAMGDVRILLASNSPRRRQLLALGGWEFTSASSNVDESSHPAETPAAYVVRLAQEKARVSAQLAKPGQIVIGSDTTVVIDGSMLGKPAGADEATSMLRRLRGRTHQVYTGIAALDTGTGSLLTDLCVTDVPMRAYSDDEISAYVATGDPLDKAGPAGGGHGGLLCQRDGTAALSSDTPAPTIRRPAAVRPARRVPGFFEV